MAKEVKPEQKVAVEDVGLAQRVEAKLDFIIKEQADLKEWVKRMARKGKVA